MEEVVILNFLNYVKITKNIHGLLLFCSCHFHSEFTSHVKFKLFTHTEGVTHPNANMYMKASSYFPHHRVHHGIHGVNFITFSVCEGPGGFSTNARVQPKYLCPCGQSTVSVHPMCQTIKLDARLDALNTVLVKRFTLYSCIRKDLAGDVLHFSCQQKSKDSA